MIYKPPRNQLALILFKILTEGRCCRFDIKGNFSARICDLKRLGLDIQQRRKKDSRGVYLEADIEAEFFIIAQIMYPIINKDHLRSEKKIYS